MRSVVRLLTGVVAGALALGVVVAPPASAADEIVIWSDAAHASAIRDLLPDGYEGTPVTVVEKDPATVRADLATVGARQAPDLLWGDLAWTGELASADLLAPITLKKDVRAQFRANVLAGSVVEGKQYGLPVQISNLALITNTALVPQQPRTFAELSDLALKLSKRKKKINVPFALPQGEGTSPWTTYPLFSGLGGYLFARKADGSLDVGSIGLSSPALRANAAQIDTWNSSGLISAKLTAEAAKAAFAEGRSPFWLAGPEALQDLLALKFAYRIGAMPPMRAGLAPAPLLTIHGFMVTPFAEKHGVSEQVGSLVGSFLARQKSQQRLAAASGQFPANLKAAEVVDTGGGRIRAIGNAGAAGVPMPNVPQAGVLWGPYATAWSESTAGAKAIRAAKAFRAAQRAAEAALAGGDVPTQ